MKTEIEVKFVDIDIDAIRTTLVSCGAICEQPMRLMKRAIIETPALAAKNGYIRVRDEGHAVTLTYKQIDEVSLTGAKEIELTVSDFEAMLGVLAQGELPAKSFQESKRETWKLGEVEVVIDVWPHLSPYIEIEGDSEVAVRHAADMLGFDWESAMFGAVMEVYQHQYPTGDASQLVKCARITFDEPLPAVIAGV
jgi:adenylate cyclase class 2